MKTVSVIFLLVLAAFVKSELPAEEHQKMIDISKACMTKSGATYDVIEMALAGKFSDDVKLKEHMLCVGKNAGLADEAGNCKKEEVKRKIMTRVDDEARADVIVGKCCDEKATPQETAFENTKCIFKEMLAT